MKKYAIISNKKRNQLIQRVVENGESVSRVAKQLRMKLTSAKNIIRTFKKSGKIFDKKKVINRKLRHRNNQLSYTDQHKDNSEHKQAVTISGLKVEFMKQNQEILLSEQKLKTNDENIQKMNIFYHQMSSYYQQIYFQQQYINYVNILKYFTQNVHQQQFI